MNKNVIIGIVAIIILAIGAGIYSSNSSSKEKLANSEMMHKKDALVTQQKEDFMVNQEKITSTLVQKENNATIKNDESASMPKADTVMKVGSYEVYSFEKIARAAEGDVVLFFHASWCPSCRALNADIEKNISSIPGGLSILKVDYDKETELKNKYGVTTQHTLVQVNKDGNLIKKWSGSSKLENIISEMK